MTPMNEPFDPTKPFTTRDGRKARLLGELNHPTHPLGVVITEANGVENMRPYTRIGTCSSTLGTSDCDLINTPPPPMELFVNYYEDGSRTIHDSQEDAALDLARLRCVRFVEAK
jgi:hypothetical protein